MKYPRFVSLPCEPASRRQCLITANYRQCQKTTSKQMFIPVGVVQVEERVLSELVVTLLCQLLELLIHHLKEQLFEGGQV